MRSRTEIFVERTFDPPLTPEHVHAMALASGACFALHKVDWHESLLSADGGRMLCRFSAPDMESVRIAFRQAGELPRVLWAGTVHKVPDPVTANVVVSRRFDEPITLEEIQAVENAGAWCLETHRVKFARTFFSLDRKRMICLYSAPDAEAVRLAQRQAGMPVEQVWAFRKIQPEDLP